MQKLRFLLPAFLIVIVGLVANAWILSTDNFFINDDYDWLKTAVLSSYGSIFHLFPTQTYNDRPVGAIFIKALYDVFGDNNVHHHIVLMLLHLLNGVLVYFYAKRLLVGRKIDEARTIAAFAGIWFVAWPEALFLIGWDAGIFDLLGTTLCLAFLALHIISIRKKHFLVYGLINACVLFLALRTKEMAVTLPLIAVAVEISITEGNLLKRLKNSVRRLSLPFVVLLIYLAVIVSKLGTHEHSVGPNSPYYLSPNPLFALFSIAKYADLYLNPFNPAYSVRSTAEVMIVFILVLIALFGIYTLERREKHNGNMILFIFLACLSLGPVLLLKNNVQRLYLYFPSVFLAILIGYCIIIVLNVVLHNQPRKVLLASALCFAIIVPLIAIATPANQLFRTYYQNVGRENRSIYMQIKELPRPQPGQTIEIIGSTDSTPFQERLGVIEPFIIIFRDGTLKGRLINGASTCPDCYVIRYDKGAITLVQH